MATLNDLLIGAQTVSVSHNPTGTCLLNVAWMGNGFAGAAVDSHTPKDDIAAPAVYVSQEAASRDEWRLLTDDEMASLWH